MNQKKDIEDGIEIVGNVHENKELFEVKRIVKVTEKLNRDKMLDEGVFLAICGLNQCREKTFITGVVRLEMAVARIQKVIDYINKNKIEKQITDIPDEK